MSLLSAGDHGGDLHAPAARPGQVHTLPRAGTLFFEGFCVSRPACCSCRVEATLASALFSEVVNMPSQRPQCVHVALREEESIKQHGDAEVSVDAGKEGLV